MSIRQRITYAGAIGALSISLAVVACGGGGTPTPGTTPSPTPTPTPTPGTGGTSVGPSGGTVTSTDGSATLVIPANALSTTVQMSVAALASRPLDPAAVLGTGVQIDPASTQFAVPATLTLTYAADKAPSGISPSELRAVKLQGNAWEQVSDSTVDTGATTVTARIGSGGGYGVRFPDPSATCSGPEYRQFDFWLGSWTYVVNGSTAGINEITRHATGCWILENYSNGSGRSVSVYETSTGRWHQTYIDVNSMRLVLVGKLDGQRMALVSQGSPSTRFIWDPVSADRVLYFPEQLNGGTWSGTANSWYQRR